MHSSNETLFSLNVQLSLFQISVTTTLCRLWSSSGIRRPLDDQSLQSVVVTDIWKRLNCTFNENRVSLLECMVLDLKRTAQRAFFIDSPGYVADQENVCSVAELGRVCQRYDLAFEVISPV